MTRVAVTGAAGRMGSLVMQAVREADGLEVVAAIDPAHVGEQLHGLEVVGTLDAVEEAGAHVAVDFTRPDQVMGNIEHCLTRGIHVVVGTTGISPDDHERIASWASQGGANAIVAPNFSIGAVLSQRLAEQAAAFFPAAEVIELHHDQKLDAPSGTAASTARKIAAARKEAWEGPDDESVEGVRGGKVDGIPVHSVRLPGFVAHQEVIFGGLGQTLSIRHDSTDRTSFMPGVVLAIKQVASRPGLTVGLEPLLGL